MEVEETPSPSLLAALSPSSSSMAETFNEFSDGFFFRIKSESRFFLEGVELSSMLVIESSTLAAERW